MKNKIKNLTLYIFSCFVFLLFSFSSTFAKFVMTSSGLAWITDFTKFQLLDTVFTITDPNGAESGKLYGAEGSFAMPNENEFKSMTEDEYNAMIEEIVKFDSSAASKFPEYGSEDCTYSNFKSLINTVYDGEVNKSSVKASDFAGYYFLPESMFVNESNNTFLQSKYSLSNIKNVVYNIYNSTTQPMLITFYLCYYAQKTTSKSNAVAFGIYNTTIHGDAVSSDSTTILKGGFPTIASGDVKSYHEVNIPNVNASRGGDGIELVDNDKIFGFIDNNTEYYPHITTINPYQVKSNPTLGLNETLGAGQTRGNDFALRDFVLYEGELFSYNLSLYYGGYGVSSNAGFAFLAGIEINCLPATEEVLNLITNS